MTEPVIHVFLEPRTSTWQHGARYGVAGVEDEEGAFDTLFNDDDDDDEKSDASAGSRLARARPHAHADAHAQSQGLGL